MGASMAKNIAGLFVFGTNASKEDHFGRAGNGHGFGKAAFGPAAVVKMVPFEHFLF
jgi:hypothetical protein